MHVFPSAYYPAAPVLVHGVFKPRLRKTRDDASLSFTAFVSALASSF